MTLDMVNRLFYVVVWGGGFFAFWQITNYISEIWTAMVQSSNTL
jgi:hypothetical protein